MDTEKTENGACESSPAPDGSAEAICDQIKSYWRDVLTDSNGPDWNRGYNEALMVCVDIVRQNVKDEVPK